MKEVLMSELCTGCSACASICPKNAIELIEHKDGFKYPIIDQEKCINCGLCQKVCPVLNTKKNESLNDCYLAYNKDDEELKTSSSGAIFSLIANYFLEHNGIVIGASFTESKKLKHIAITKKEDLKKLKGSKYLQSDVDNIFRYIKEIKDKDILFVGTPCQVAGLKSFVKTKNNLFCIDLICHGVPSPKLFQKYVEELEKKNKDELITYNFRDKKTGWKNYSNTATFKKQKITTLAKDNEYMKLFLSNIALRESCYKCNFKLGNKYSDLTLGDFWGVEKFYPELQKINGISAIIVNTEKGKEIIEKVKQNAVIKECKIEEILTGNPSLSTSSKCPKDRKAFFENLENKEMNILVKKYTQKSFIKRLYHKIKRTLK